MITSTSENIRYLNLWTILLWEGRLNNGRLRELFGVGDIRASQMIREFRERHQDCLTWNSVTRSFHATEDAYRLRFVDKESKHGDAVSLARYLTLVGLPHASVETPLNQGTWVAFPDISVPNPKVYSKISEAIRLRRALEINYMSMREPLPHKRIISPHSLVQAGRRWHTRAYSNEHQQFRDYALGRIVSADILDKVSEKEESDDQAWQKQVRVSLVAHPDLTPDQEAVIRFEYFQNTSARTDTCRGALVHYYIQDVRAAIDAATQKPPEYQLAVSNIDEVRPWLFSGK